MADPLSPSPSPAAPPRRPRTGHEHRRHLVRRAAGHHLFEGMRRPWLTYGLLAVMALSHLALGLVMVVEGQTDLLGALIVVRPEALLVRAGGQAAAAIDQGEVWRLVSCVFLHNDGLHLFMNGLALFGLGRLCESLYGRPRFLFLFLLAGLAGSTLSYLGGHRLSVGASGAVFGLMGAPIVFGWRHRDELPEGLGDQLRRALLPWVGLNLLVGLMLPFIDNLAHLGGLLTGGALALLLGNRVVPGRQGASWATGLMVAFSLALLGGAAAGVASGWL